MKIPPIPGIIHKVGKVSTVFKGFAQSVIITQPEKKNDQGYKLSKEQFFVVNIWSNKQDDSRFLKPEFEGVECVADCYLDGQRWTDPRRGLMYNHKLNLDKWLEKTETKK